MNQIVIASGNQGKIAEFQKIFARYGIRVIPQASLNVAEIDEPFCTFVENSLHKARHCAKVTGLPALADDSGLCVTALNGAPGVYSARYAGHPKSDLANLNKLLSTMKDITSREAFFYCCLVFVRSHDDPQPVIAEGIFNGQIAHEAKGNNGHGYDPIFWIPELQKTASEIAINSKNQISHRGKAIQELLLKLKSFNLINTGDSHAT